MAERRVNPDTGILEENVGLIFDDWQPVKNEHDRVERVNPTSGVVEEDRSTFGGTFGHDWAAKRNEVDRAERVHPETGIVEEDRSTFHGALGHDWVAKPNESDRAQRVNPNTGLVEEDRSTFHGAFGYAVATQTWKRGPSRADQPKIRHRGGRPELPRRRVGLRLAAKSCCR